MAPRPSDPVPEDEAPLIDLRPLDRRRLKEIRHWLEGERSDAPTERELREFLDWVYGEIEWSLARHRPTEELIGWLNAAREELKRSPGP